MYVKYCGVMHIFISIFEFDSIFKGFFVCSNKKNLFVNCGFVLRMKDLLRVSFNYHNRVINLLTFWNANVFQIEDRWKRHCIVNKKSYHPCVCFKVGSNCHLRIDKLLGAKSCFVISSTALLLYYTIIILLY